MKKVIIAVMVIACLIITSTFLITSPLMLDDRSVKTRNGKNSESTDVTSSNAVDSQTSKPQSKSQNEVGTLDVKQNEQKLNQDQSMVAIQTVPNQTVQPSVPFPDGRIFLRATNGADDAIPYIPTQYAKTTTPPIIPSESDI